MANKIFIKTFGCQMNEYDSNRIFDTVKKIGFFKTSDQSDADCYLINTCHIRDKAKEKVYHEVGRVKKIFRNKKKPILVVAGCVAQAENEEMLKREPYIDIVVGPQSYHQINSLISNYKKESFQGDVNVCKYYETYGVKTIFEGNRLIITKDETKNLPKKIEIDLNDNPDLAQTIIVTSFGLNIPTKLTGLSTLKVKETNRLEALYNELTKLGAKCKITNDSIEIFKLKKLNIKHCIIDTYDDHRMALAFAPLSILKPLEINEPSVVSKSFPEFWKKLKDVGFSVDF